MSDSLLEIFKQLNPTDQQSLLKFGRFLLSDDNTELTKKPAEKQLIKEFVAGKTDESVVKTISRLKEIYYMLNPNDLMGDVTKKMTEHLINGKKKAIVIDELEIIFKKKYQKYLEKFE